MHVAVAIVGFRNPEDIRACLRALNLSTYKDFEVVVCENGGPDAYGRLVAAVPSVLESGQRVRIVQAPGNVGYAGGVNIAMGEAPDADAWWILNPDTQPEAGTLQALVDRLAQGDCQAVGGVLYRPDGKVQTYGGRWRPWLARAESIGFGLDKEAQVPQQAVEATMNYVTGASMLVGREFQQAAGPMREDFFLYCEEIEWCLRAVNKGMRLGVAPEARVLHDHGSTTGSGQAIRARPRLPIYLDERNKILLTRDLFPWHLPVASIAALGLLTWRFLLRGAPKQFGYALAGWRDGLRGIRGAPQHLQLSA